MDNNNAEFLKRLLATFKVEATEHLETLSSGLAELGKTSAFEDQIGTIETIYRDAHSLKGAARAVNLKQIEKICQSMESVFAALKNKSIVPSPHLFDILYEAVDVVEKLVSISDSGAEITADEKSAIRELVKKLESAANGTLLPAGHVETHEPDIDVSSLLEGARPVPDDSYVSSSPPEPQQTAQTAQIKEPVPHKKSSLSETVRISTARLDTILLGTEEMVYAKLMAAQHENELVEINVLLSTWQKELDKIRPDIKIIKQLLESNDNDNYSDTGTGIDGGNGNDGSNANANANKDLRAGARSQCLKLVDFFDMNYTTFKILEGRTTAFEKLAELDRRSIDGMVTNLIEDIKDVLMQPVSSLMGTYPRFIRELSRAQGKDVEFETLGEDLQIDRRILEEMKDPFMHIIRNFVDHGIEKPDERIKKNKPRRGKITVSVSQKSGTEVEISITDDGAGIDIEKVKSSAIKSGIISPEKAKGLSEQEVLSLLFQSGVSTSPIVTEISGRGLGLAIVREKLEKLGGEVHVQTQRDVGTTFTIVLPLTLSTFRGVLLQVDEQSFIIPTMNIERAQRVYKDEIATMENMDAIQFEGTLVPLIRLGDVLGVSNGGAVLPDKLFVIIISLAGKDIAFTVDEIMAEQEVLVKSLGSQLSRTKYFSSATILGSGQVVPIINVYDLMKSAAKIVTGTMPQEALSGSKEKTKKSILVVEDSITSRTMIKDILESANYHVVTAVDGVEGFETLGNEHFDLVISDVEMPRMNGFDLTAKIRNHEKFADLPVVLATSLQSKEGQERGIEVGANAYVIKSSFDNGDLLETVRRFV